MIKGNDMSFTSPRTNLTYTVEAKTDRRVVAYVEGQAVWADETTWNLFLDGKFVQFSLTEAGIPDAIARAEGVHDGWTSSRFD
jgi:hypothetical protein